MHLPMRIRRVAGQPAGGLGLLTVDISSCGVRFEAPHNLDVGLPVHLEIELLDGPLGGRRLLMCTEAHIVRAHPASRPGWTQFAAAFDEIRFHRTEPEAMPGKALLAAPDAAA